jgi:hypothetical protein
LIFKVKGQGHWVIFVTVEHPCEHSRINILQWILTKLDTYIVLRRVWNPIDFQGQRSRGQIFTAQHPCEQSRINILQWILTKLGTYLGESGTLLMFKVKGQGHWVKFLPHNILVNTLESRSFNGF